MGSKLIPESIIIDFDNIHQRICTHCHFMRKCLPKDVRIYVPIFVVVFVLLILAFSVLIDRVSQPDEFTVSCVRVHNSYRYKHNTPLLGIDSALVDFAKSRAIFLAETNIFKHADDLKGFGENLYSTHPAKTCPCDEAVKLWYNEIKSYNFNNPSRVRGVVEHFTQVIWKDTLNVGCAQAYSDKTQTVYIVCNYSPAGNYIHLMKENVLPVHINHN